MLHAATSRLSAMPKLLYIAATGPQDPTRCSIPFHLAANGAAAAGYEAAVVLAGDATELLKPDSRDPVRGVGIPPLRELFEACRARGIRLHV
jgi:predicted peroxiredoxin